MLVVTLFTMPKTACRSVNGEYTLIAQTMEEPFMFGSQDCRLFLKKRGRKICTYDFNLRDDGGKMSEEHWEVTWNDSGVDVRIHGSEMSDIHCRLYYDGHYLP